MKPTYFKGSNQILGPPSNMTEDDCEDLYVLADGQQVLSCWLMSWRERFSALIFGRAWLCVHGTTQPAVWINIVRTELGPAEGGEADDG